MGQVFVARTVLPRPELRVDDGGFLVVGGAVRRLLTSAAAVRRAARTEGVRPVDLGDGVVTPGLVCAHAHLELSFLRGEIAPGPAMTDWIRAVLVRRSGRSTPEMQRAAAGAARELADAGTTLVADVQSPECEAAVAASFPLRRVAMREVLDGGDPGRRAAALASVARRLPRRALQLEGLSPHGPHTVSPELLAGVARLAGRRRVPVQLHWSETPEEVEWLARGSGPFRAVLGESPRTAGLDLIERAGLLGSRTSLVHGNCLSRGEPTRIARAGSIVVHCPGSHAFFDRAPFPLERYRRAGVTLALGTDSLASNDALDMRREMALLRAAHPGLSPHAVWTMATVGGARALGLAASAGALAAGSWADFVQFDVDGTRPRVALDELTAGLPGVRGVWLGGRRLGRVRRS
jgi:cytosine/adenosine deaminase-related metal-dependent hydrolase